jgi:hypothetical protein
MRDAVHADVEQLLMMTDTKVKVGTAIEGEYRKEGSSTSGVCNVADSATPW